jgi:hypothetical protein
MKRLLNTLFYIFVIIEVIYHISVYENITLSQMLLFTVVVFMFGAVVTLDIINIVIRYIKKGVESCD